MMNLRNFAGWDSDTTQGREKQEQSAQAMCGFLHSFLLSLCFIWTFCLHESLSSISELEQAMLFELQRKPFDALGRSIEDVHDTKLFWQWVENGLLPTVVNQRDALGHALPESEWGYLTEYNRIIGGIRLVQTRSAKTRCPHGIASHLYSDCYPAATGSLQRFGAPACTAQAASRSGTCYNASKYVGRVDMVHDEGFVKDSIYDHFEMWLDTLEPEAVLRSRIFYLEERHWVDKQTKTVAADLLFLNSQREPLVCCARMLFTLRRSGYLDVSIKIETMPVAPYAAAYVEKVVLECLYVICLVMLAAPNWFSALRRGRVLGRECFRGLRYMRVTDAVDLANVLLGMVLASMWAAFVRRCDCFADMMNELRRPAAAPLHNGSDFEVWAAFQHAVAHVEEEAHAMMAQLHVIRDIASLTVFALIVRCFKTWEYIPAMAVIPRTARSACRHLLSMCVAATILVLMWAGAGAILFGHQIHAYTRPASAIAKTMEIVLVADSSLLERMSSIAPGFAHIWHWSLLLIMYLLVLNIVLAVLVQSFTDVSAELEKTSVFAQAAVAYHYLWKRIKRVSRTLSGGGAPTPTSSAPAADPEDASSTEAADEAEADALEPVGPTLRIDEI